ncbi:Neural proliferation differentiation and control protein 1, partial [Fasciola gigantica]
VPVQAPGVEDSIQLVRREDKPSPGGLGQLGGFRSHMNWQPITIGVICSVLGIMAVLGAAIYYQRVQMTKKRNQDNDFCGIRQAKPSPTGSLLGDTTSVGLDGDRKLAHSAQMYHYQHQKQQMLAVERASDPAQASEEGSDESDVEEGDFTVYECPGLATTEQLEVENPLYEGDAAANGPSTNGSYGEIIGASDLEENSDSTPTTTKTEEH